MNTLLDRATYPLLAQMDMTGDSLRSKCGLEERPIDERIRSVTMLRDDCERWLAAASETT